MSFSLPQRKASGKGALTNGKGQGRKAWVVGEKLWDNNALHLKSLSKGLEVPSVDAEGVTSAAVQGLRAPGVWMTPEDLLKHVSAETSELINRPAIGWSMLGAIFETFLINIQEGAKTGLYTAEFVHKFEKDYNDLHVLQAAKIMNSQDYPGLDRSEAQCAESVQAILTFASRTPCPAMSRVCVADHVNIGTQRACARVAEATRM
jgi:hypothetical protein